MFRFSYPLKDVSAECARRVGIPNNPAPDLAFVPGVSGSVSDFNANGKEEPLKDKPKIRVPRMVMSSWNDWHGDPHSGIQHRYYLQWQKNRILPPEELFYIRYANGGLSVMSGPLKFSHDAESRIIHTMNLFLEAFGSVNLVSIEGEPVKSPTIKRVNWLLLPKGEQPWPRIQKLLEERLAAQLKAGEPADAAVVLKRMEWLKKYEPAAYGLGQGGFSDYIAIEFPRKKVWLLESQSLGNATYVFGENWEVFSKLSKKEIIQGELCKQRIVHDKRWWSATSTLLR